MNIKKIITLTLFLSPHLTRCMESLDEDELNQPVVRADFYRVTLKVATAGSLAQNKLDFIERDGALINSIEYHTLVPRENTIAVSDLLAEASLTVNAINPDFVKVACRTEYNSWFKCLYSSLSCCASLLCMHRVNVFDISHTISNLCPKEVKSETVTIPFGEEHTIVITEDSDTTYKASIKAEHLVIDRWN
jgi:hypothetical protein